MLTIVVETSADVLYDNHQSHACKEINVPINEISLVVDFIGSLVSEERDEYTYDRLDVLLCDISNSTEQSYMTYGLYSVVDDETVIEMMWDGEYFGADLIIKGDTITLVNGLPKLEDESCITLSM